MKISGFSKLAAAIGLLIVAAAIATPSIAMQGDTIADIVLGQPNFADNPQNFINGRDLDGPVAVAIDTSVTPNRLYVADSANNRVLGYNSVTTLMNGGLADLVIGQPVFTSSACNNGGLSAGSLCVPDGIAVDATGNLYVTDNKNNRVLEYNTPFAGCGSFPCVGAPANRVFGQGGSFNSATCNNGGTSANSLCGPWGVTLDSKGNLYVADSSNNRVLEYNTPLTNMTADTVFGQANLSSANFCSPNTTVSANTLCQPRGVALDANNNLYIADANNNRVLEYNTPLTTDTTADTVFGQSGSFTSHACPGPGRTSSSTLCQPYAVALDATGDLYVADFGESRVLEYNTPLSNTVADRVFGQLGGFKSRTQNTLGLSARSLNQPGGVALDGSGNLYVADSGNNRVLGFNPPFTTNPSADLVIGQNSFVTNGFNSAATTASSMQYPAFVALDTSVVPNRLYVGDQLSYRVLGWKDVTALSNNAPADLVIGQPDFVSSIPNNGGINASSLGAVNGLAVDAAGNLYISDVNNRVLGYNNPFAACSSFPCVGGPANLVFGQGGSFTSSLCNAGGESAATLCLPTGLATDAQGNLYVSDTSNNRVLEFNTPLTNGTTAAMVFGQGGSFTSNTCNNGGLSAASLCGPSGLATDASGDLFVADLQNYRVLQYDSPLTTDTIADQVFGQADFISNMCSSQDVVSANSLCGGPFGIGLDTLGNLYAVDTGNNRVLEYNNPLSNDTANLVFGQFGSFTTRTSNNGGVSASSLSGPLDVKADSNGNIYIADAINGRVLEYDNPLGLTTTPTPIATATPTATATDTATATATATDTATSTATATATATTTSTATATATDTATATATATDTATPTATATTTATATATATDTTTATATATSTATATDTATTTSTPTPTATATDTATATATPTATPITSMTLTASLAFGNVAVGQTVTKSLTVTNTGAIHPLLVSSATQADTEYALSGTGTCGPIPITVAPKSNCTMGVSFTPSTLGAHNASLMLSDNATTSPQHLTLTGTGLADLTLSKSSLAWGSVKFGVKTVQSFSVTNHQTQSVTLGESFSGTNAADFSITGGTCAATLASKAACSIIVTFKPGAIGTESATLSMSDSPDPMSPYAVSLSTGPTIPATVAPISLAYGTLAATQASKTKTVTVTNLSGFSLPVSESISGANAPDFTVTGGTCRTTSSPNSSCTIAVTFTPTAAGSAESAIMAVTIGNDPTSPHDISLTGTSP